MMRHVFNKNPSPRRHPDICAAPDCLQRRDSEVHITAGQSAGAWIRRVFVAGFAVGALCSVMVSALGWCG
jgi:hypothetical protein